MTVIRKRDGESPVHESVDYTEEVCSQGFHENLDSNQLLVHTYENYRKQS